MSTVTISPEHGVHDAVPSTHHGQASEYELDHAARAPIPLSTLEEEDSQDEEDDGVVDLIHPIPAMQAAFEESIVESADMDTRYNHSTLDVQARRQQLLEQEDINQGYSSRWRQAAGAKFHPLWKTVAQISFGVHLLHKGTAESENAVVNILQQHIDEVDSFAEETAEDFDLAIRDIEERVDCLSIPLEHSREFNRMLCDKAFRTSILQNNDAIERIMYRTRKAMEIALVDVKQGHDAVTELAKYLDRLSQDWSNHNGDLIRAFQTMKGNAEGWCQCFDGLRQRGEDLTHLMLHLQSVVDEMARRAGIASRRMTPTGLVGRKSYVSTRSSTEGSPSSRKSSLLDKALPSIPPVQLPTKEVNVMSNLYPVDEEKAVSAQPRSSPVLRRDSAQPPTRLAAMPALKVVTTHHTPPARSTATTTGSAYERPRTPPRSSKRPVAIPTRETTTPQAIDSAYVSVPPSPTFAPKHSTDSGSSPTSSITSTPRTSYSQMNSDIPAPLNVRPQLHTQNSSRRPSMTALPIYTQSQLKPAPLSIPVTPQITTTPKKHHLGSVKNFLDKKRQSVAAIAGGFI